MSNPQGGSNETPKTPCQALPAPPRSNKLKAISRPPSRAGSRSRLFDFLIDLLALRRPGNLPGFFMAPASGCIHRLRA